MESTLAESKHPFGIPGVEIPGTAAIVNGNGGLRKVRITSREASGEIYLHGAHITSWKPAGREEALFVSSKSRWDQEHAIRGGIPICFPWFGSKADDPQAPAHGFVRTKAWELGSIAQVGNGVAVSMFTGSGEDTKRWSPGEFRLDYRVTFAAELRLELEVTNTGQSSLHFEEALHAYHSVENILKARVGGLDTLHYIDKTDANSKKVQHGEVAIVSETDRVYLDRMDAIELEDPDFSRRTQIVKENSRTTVVWNPWVQKARSLADFADDEWMRMICIEVSNVSDFGVDLEPGQQHIMRAVIGIRDF